MILINRIIALISTTVCLIASLLGVNDAVKIESRQYPVEGSGRQQTSTITV